MLKAYIFLVLWLIVACNCHSLETRARIRSSNNDDEHVHIKVLLPKILRKQKLPHYTTRPHYAKRLPTHYETISRPNFPQQQAATTTQDIFSQHHEDFEVPAPTPMLTTEHEILAHMAATSPLADNDISHKQSIRMQRQKQKQQQKRTPTMMPPPPPAPLSSPPMLAQHLYGGTPTDIYSSTLLEGNVLTADDFLREVQQLYAQKYGSEMTPTIMMEPQMQALTKSTMSTPIPTTTPRKKQKKRKLNINDYNSKNNNNNNNNKTLHFSKAANPEQQYYTKEPNYLQNGFKPYSSNQAYSNYYYYDDYNNKNFFDNKNTKFSITDHTPMVTNELNTDDTTDDIDPNSSSTEDYTADSVSDTVMAFSTPIHPEEQSSPFLSSSSSPYFNEKNMQTNNNNYNYFNTNVNADDYDDVNNNNYNDNDGSNIGYNPISYQDLYATYSATPAAHHLSTMPTRLKFKGQQQQQQGQPLREQFVQLSSITPVVSTGIKTLRGTQRAPTTKTIATSAIEGIGNIYSAPQQPLEHYRKQKHRIKVKRNRLMVQ